jgi:putative inorganic carbon (HCO3(-)) transporter
MTTPGVSATTRDSRARVPPVDGRLVVLAAVAIAVALLVLGHRSVLALALLAAGGLVVATVAAVRWPLPTLVVATLITLLDEKITPRVLPEGLSLGPIGLSEPLLVVVGVVLAIGAAQRGTLLPAVRDPVVALAAAFAGVAVGSAIVNGVPIHVATLGILMTVDALAIYVIARSIRVEERGVGMAIAGIVLTVAAIALFGIAQVVVAPTLFGFAAFTGRFGEGVRITSIIGNPNMLAAVLGLTIPFALYASRHLADRRWRWLARTCLFVLVLALLLSFSRGGWLAVGIGVILGALVVDWRSVPVFILVVVLAWGTTLVLPRNVGLALLGLDPEEFGGSILGSTIDRLDSLGGGGDVRAQYLVDGVRIISANPLLGVGPGRYGGAAASIIPSPVYEEYGASLFGYRTVHNFWLHLTGELGVVGAAAFLTLIAGMLVRLVMAARRTAGLALVVTGGAATMLVVVSLHSFTEMIFEGNMPAILIWLILGLASLLAPAAPILDRLRSPRARPAEADGRELDGSAGWNAER